MHDPVHTRKLEDGGFMPSDSVDPEHQRVTQAFIDACSGGNVDDLLQLLDPRWPVTSTLVRGIQRLDRSIVDPETSPSIPLLLRGNLVEVPRQHEALTLASMGGDLPGSSPWKFDWPG
jgi:hypothetical protein